MTGRFSSLTASMSLLMTSTSFTGTWLAISPLGAQLQGGEVLLRWVSCCDYQAHPPVMAPSIDGIHFVSPIHPTLNAIRAEVSKDAALEGQDVNVDFVWGPHLIWKRGYWQTRGRRGGWVNDSLYVR
ncbi:hypothetical protein B0T14DRAFT_325563 [Immersiella caudata]|uniref:Uncharacterized protein n=1 Tax=Immersiella caudata TaxID=314043 RepID=A0AA39W4D8_9PEZI|nr:hypothetical protein B0T14DRAFT_325563 [Immersiella caudata]